MDQSQLIDGVRAECGKLENTVELENDDIIRYSGWILDRIAERITVKSIRYITSIKDEREYDVASTTLRIQKVFRWDGIDDTLLSDLGTHKESTNITDATSYYNFPSLWKIEMARKIRGLPRIKYDFDPINRKLHIDPAPSEAGKKYWYVSVEKTQWTLDKVPTDFEELVIIGTTFRALEQVALKRTEQGGIHREGGTVDYPASELKRFVDSKKDEFYDQLRIKAMIYSR
jgi:hypothetical protein